MPTPTTPITVSVRYRIDDGQTEVITLPAGSRLAGEAGYDIAQLAVQISGVPVGGHVVEILDPPEIADLYEVDVDPADDATDEPMVMSVGLRR